MRYLITGGAGFIGSHLSELLLSLGHEVVVLDDLSTGSLHNINHLKAHRGFKCVIDTATNRGLLEELVDHSDAVFHLAAAVGVKLIVESPVRTIETNVRVTELVLQYASKHKKKVLLTSTSEVYGKSAEVPFREDADLVLGTSSTSRWSYACSKLLDEFLALAYWRERMTPVVITRLFNTVGPRQTGRYGMVVPTLVRQALAGQPLTVHGSGAQSRCFAHVEDIVGALAKLMELPSAVGEIFNLGSTQETTILGLAELVRSRTQSPAPIKLIPYADAYAEGFEDMQRRVPNLDKAAKAIGFRTTKSLAEIVDDVASKQRLDDVAFST